MNATLLLVLCFAFHLCYFFSIFDIYFRSPIEHGIELVKQPPESSALSKRVVLFVADGLRADTCFRFLGRDQRYHDEENVVGKDLDPREANYQADKLIWENAPTSFLRDVVEKNGSWGISHTRVPTESRPGHVAVIAGFYEDVSAVTKGWQDNPVEFDHVFNQSRRTWLWGSPDITRMFAKRHPHVTDWFYSPEEEDFAAKDLTKLDTWVFDKVKQLFDEFETNETLKREMNQDQVFFFLHLLGLDSNGHAYRPHAPEYYYNMASVDQGVSKMVELFESHFPDGKTSYVFTSDHGMGNLGAHGDGDPTNTRTPLIVWGSGAHRPIHRKPNENDDDPRNGINTGFTKQQEMEMSRNWGLDHLKRTDVEQADIAPLLASLLGIPFPVHSVGRLPTDFIEPGKYTISSLFQNAKQLMAQVRHKEHRRKSRQLFFKPFPNLQAADDLLHLVPGLIHDQEYEKAQESCEKAMEICLEGLHYYQVYDRPYLSTIIVVGYLGWIVYLAAFLTEEEEEEELAKKSSSSSTWTVPAISTGLLGLITIFYQLMEESPFMYHLYVGFAAYFWVDVLRKPHIWSKWTARTTKSNVSQLFIYIIGTQIIVIGYTYRGIFAVLFLGLAAWPYSMPSISAANTLQYNSHTGVVKSISGRGLRMMWAFSCTLLGSFTLAPLEIHDSPLLLSLGVIFLVALLVKFFSGDLEKFTKQRVGQLGLIMLALYLCISTDQSLRDKAGLPWINQTLTIASFIVSFYLIPQSAMTPYKRYLSVFAGLATPYCLLSVNYEVLFYTCLGFTILQWLIIERCLFFQVQGNNNKKKKQYAGVTMDDVRAAFMFVCFVHIAFFGTGNLASMSSFQISSVYRFITLFSPFIMGALLIFKLCLPYILVMSLVSLLATERRAAQVSMVSPASLLFVVLALYDLIALHLFFWVRDHGSWKEIGNSISQFGLANCQCILIPLLFLTATTLVQDVNMKIKNP